MLYYIRLSIFLLLIPIIGCSQNNKLDENKVVPVNVSWVKNDNIRYKISKGSQSYFNDSMQFDKKFNYFMNLKVKDVLEDGFLLEADFEGASNIFPFEISGMLPGNKSLDQKFPHIIVNYKTDKFGKFVEITNVDQLNKEINKFIDNLKVDKDFSRLETAIRENLLSNLKNYAQAKVIKEDLFSDLKLLHAYYGLTFNLDSTLHYEDTRPNIWEGENLPVVEDIKAEWIDTTMLKIERNTVFDDIETNKSVQKYIKGLLKNDTSDQSKLRDYQVTVDDQLTHLMDPMNGWVYLMRSIRTLSDSYRKDNVSYLIYEVQK